MVVSWTIGTSPDAELVNTMLDAAIETVTETSDRPVVHSDRGGHYRWPGWLSRVSEANLTRSMSRKACSPDNAACGGFFGRLKNELFYPRDWKSVTVEQFIEVLDDYIRWYNEKRIKISFNRWASLLVTPSRTLASTSVRLTHSCNVCGTQPILGAMDSTAAHSDGYSPRCSYTILTARPRISGENLFDLLMAQSSQSVEPP